MTLRSASRLVVALSAAFTVAACGINQPTTAGPTTRPGTTTRPAPTTAPGASAPQVEGISITLDPFATVAGGPLAMTAPDDGTGRLFVAAQDGKIWLVDRDGGVGSEPMVDLSARLRSGGEQGLLGLATHPNFPTDPRIFVNYTDTAGDTIVASLVLDSADPDRFDADSHEQLLFIDQPAPNHNGGGVVFGPDGYLYVSLGDGGGGGDPQDNGQNPDALLGKILRIDIDPSGANAYDVPDDNPFAGGGGAPEVWHLGLRNPWRLSFDRANGDLWIADVGQGAWEEVDVARAGTAGLNFGWNLMEGSSCYGGGECETDGLALPVSEYGRDLGCTVIGGYVYRGEEHGFLAGTYVFADYCSGRIFAINAASDGPSPPTVVGEAEGRLSSFGEDADGELYLMALQGEIWRVTATQP